MKIAKQATIQLDQSTIGNIWNIKIITIRTNPSNVDLLNENKTQKSNQNIYSRFEWKQNSEKNKELFKHLPSHWMWWPMKYVKMYKRKLQEKWHTKHIMRLETDSIIVCLTPYASHRPSRMPYAIIMFIFSFLLSIYFGNIIYNKYAEHEIPIRIPKGINCFFLVSKCETGYGDFRFGLGFLEL